MINKEKQPNNTKYLLLMGTILLFTCFLFIWLVPIKDLSDMIACLVFGSFFLSLGFLCLLTTLKGYKIVRTLINILGVFLSSILLLLHSYSLVGTPLLTFVFLNSIPLLAVTAYEKYFGVDLPDKMILYIVLTVTTNIFALYGNKLIKVFLKLTQSKDLKLEERLLPLFRVQYIRGYMYMLFCLSYISANIEKFAGLTLIDWSVWVIYKDILIEVFLTFVAVDTTIYLWKDNLNKHD